jgi:DNA polymerase III delta prime subunit
VGMAFHRIHFLANETPSSKSLNHFIITGNPGVGKTTTAKMIANYFLHQKINILFLTDNDFSEVEGEVIKTFFNSKKKLRYL